MLAKRKGSGNLTYDGKLVLSIKGISWTQSKGKGKNSYGILFCTRSTSGFEVDDWKHPEFFSVRVLIPRFGKLFCILLWKPGTYMPFEGFNVHFGL